MDPIQTLLLGAVAGAFASAAFSYFIQKALLREQHAFQQKLAEDQMRLQEALFQKQKQHQNELAMEQCNFQRTGVASFEKIGGRIP